MLLVVVAIASVVMGIFVPFELAAQARSDRAYQAQFQHAAAELARTGRMPETAPAGTPEGASIYPLATGGWDCPAAFSVPPSDRLVLSFWRGEWTECYAHPSGRTTLRTSLVAQMQGGAGQLLLILWIVALAAIWGAARLLRGIARRWSASRISAA